MRTFFGYAAAVIAAGAVSAYGICDYADHHSASTLNHWLRKTHVFLADSRDPCGPVAPAAANRRFCSTSLAAPPADSNSVQSAQAGRASVIRIEEKPAGLAKNLRPGKIVIPEEQETTPSGADNTTAKDPCEMPPEVRALMQGLQRFEEAQKAGIEECIPSGPIMPYCEDEEPERATVMPPSDDTPGTATYWSILGFWMKFFHVPTAGATETCEPPAAPAPDRQEDPAYHQQHPGCPYNGPCPKSSNAVPAGKGKPPYVPFEQELQELSPESKAISGAKNLLKNGAGTERRSKIDTTECRPSDLALPLIGWKIF
jgi:hypothetical protein